MIKEDKRISNAEKELLKSFIDKNLVKIQSAVASPPDVAWNTVRLHFDDGNTMDVSCNLDEVAINDEGDYDDFGVISITKAPSAELSVPSISSPTEELAVNKTVQKIRIFESKTTALSQGVSFCERLFTKAIAFYFEEGCMTVDKLAWFDEMLRVRFGNDPNTMLYDESQDWMNDDCEVTFEYSLEEKEL